MFYNPEFWIGVAVGFCVLPALALVALWLSGREEDREAKEELKRFKQT